MYQRFYGLAESPFGLTPDAKYLFASEAHKEALAHISYGIEERRGFVLILGEVGTGKTTLVRHVLKHLGPDVKPVFVFNSNVSFEELLQVVLRDLEEPIRGHRRADLIDALNERLLKEHSAGRRVVLIIDEAQHLSPSVLEDIRMLSNLETARSKLLQIVLVGQPELGVRLGRTSLRQLRQRIGLVAELGPLNRRDTVRYVKHRLAVAGCSERVFTRSALRTVHQRSRGTPRLINVICDKALLLGYGSNRSRIGSRIVREVTRDWSAFGILKPGAVAVHSTGRRRLPRRRSRLGRVSLPTTIAVLAVAGLVAVGLVVARLDSKLLEWSGTLRPTPSAQATAPAATAPAVAARPAPPRRATGLEAAATTPDLPMIDRARAERAETPATLDEATSPPAAVHERSASATAIAPPPPSRDVLTVPTSIQFPERPLAVVTMQTGDTLPWLLQRVYGRVNRTVEDVVQLANSDVHGGAPGPGRRLNFPPIEAATMVHKLAEQRYVVHLLTASDPMAPRVRRLSADATAAGRMVRLVPVNLWTGCDSCVRVWVGEFKTRPEAEGFYSRMRWDDAA